MNTLIKPIITEKSMQSANRGWFTFAVTRDANKTKIKKNIEELFGVNVLAIKTITIRGENKRNSKNRRLVKRPNLKKAVVKLKAGQKIDLFETPEK